ncbi:lytic transglycosylase [Pseudactinotalea sp. Z1739]|uniref:lytic transglycosylase n=1 Tax=Pseudactinotalea sp. Z1739 TaxID=3413028 RepID=UPI003C79E29B
MRAGETVSHLAARYGTSISSIVSANSLGSNALIRIGQRLTIPGSSSSGSSGSSSGGSSSGGSSSGSTGSSSGSGNATATTYTVKSGDTLTRIGRQFNISIGRLVSANNLTGSMIRVGQRLTIPAPTSSGDDLIPNTFLHYTYSDDVVAAANENKRSLLAMNVPSRNEMEQIVRQTARDMGVDPALALAIAHQESGFDARAVSPANAVGTMQVIPSSGLWANDLVGRNLNLLDPRDNVVAGVAILRALQRTSDDLPTAIASYYQGQGSVRNNGMYSDTRRYVASVQTLMTRFG